MQNVHNVIRENNSLLEMTHTGQCFSEHEELYSTSFVIEDDMSDAYTYLNILAAGIANDPTPHPASHIVLSLLSSRFNQPNTLSIVC